MMLPLLLLGSTFAEARLQNIKKMFPAGSKVGKQLKGYGCHCWRKTDDGKRQLGFGADIPIMDPIDQACYDLSTCYQRASEDFGVDPNTRYKWSADDDGLITCSQNRKAGKAAICTCDGEFVDKIMGTGDRRRTGRSPFHGDDKALLAVVDINHWGNRKNLKKNNIDWNANEVCVAGSAEAEKRFCDSVHVDKCVNHCGSCFLIREMGGCADPAGCGTCDGCVHSGSEKARCTDAERCFTDKHCSNRKRDASEQGIDCGGSCPKSCAETGDRTPFCELIRDDGACGNNCMYAFSEPKFMNADPPIMPHDLLINICETPEGKYTKLCPDQCACENQRSQVLCERGGLCKWEPDTSEPEQFQNFKGSCIDPTED